jgi:hypothetical protein
MAAKGVALRSTYRKGQKLSRVKTPIYHKGMEHRFSKPKDFF